MKRIYLDACILIYLIEKHPQFYPLIADRFTQLDQYQVAVSPLLRMEVLVKPRKDQNHALVQRYEQFLANQIILPIPESIYNDALTLRTKHNLKTPDALHVAIAQHHGCSEFWTHDQRLAKAAPDFAVSILN